MVFNIFQIWNVLLVVNVFQASEAVKGIQCNGWTLKEPKNGLLKCDQAGVVAIPGTTTCKIICSANYAASEELLHCPSDGAWAPTTNPECIADGTLTTIVVPAVLGSLFIFIFLVFVCTRLSNVCDKKTRGHESVDESYADVREYTLPRRKQTDKPNSYKEQVPNTFYEEKEQTRRNCLTDAQKGESSNGSSESDNESIEDCVTYSPKKKKSRFTFRNTKQAKSGTTKKDKIPYRKRIKLGFTACFRRVHSWRSNSGPKRVVGKPGQIGVSSICGDMNRFHSTSSYPYSSSESDEYTDTDDSNYDKSEIRESPYLSAGRNPSLDIKIADEKIVQTGCHSNTIQRKKVPPPRPPQPLPSKIKQISKATKSKKRQSSGYSSEENDRKNKGKTRNHNTPDCKRDRISKSPEKKLNPYQHYPVTGSDRQYLDFEHDYRKNGHIYEEGAYHPQYHPVESFPIKPVKKRKSSNKKHHKEKKRIAKKEIDENTTTGGVKYYSITPDKEEYKKKGGRKEKSKSLDRGEERKRKREKRNKRKRDLSPKERRRGDKSKKKETTKKSNMHTEEDKSKKPRHGRSKLEKQKEHSDRSREDRD